MNRLLLLFLLVFTLLATPVFSGTSGKITGKIADAENGTPLPGANVFIEGTTLGAAANLNGDFFILNVSPGIYTIKATMMGYNPVIVQNVRVLIDLTTTLNIQLEPKVLEMGKEVTIVAERPLIRKDITSSRTLVGAEEIAQMPVENFKQVLELQAGVIKDSDGEFHPGFGGRPDSQARILG